MRGISSNQITLIRLCRFAIMSQRNHCYTLPPFDVTISLKERRSWKGSRSDYGR